MANPRWIVFTSLTFVFALNCLGQARLPSLPNDSSWTVSDSQLREQPWERFAAPPLADEVPGDSTRSGPPADLARLLRPRVQAAIHWAAPVDSIGILAGDVSVKVPSYPLFGPPPPMITGGYRGMQISAPAAADLPDELHQFSVGMGWMRPINERWLARFMLNGAFASDLQNTSRQAWQIRGGGFGIYRPNERWSFALGAIATGRDDLPVLPAVGAIWQPTPRWKVDLTFPRPQISWMLVDSSPWQHWMYLGSGLDGGTWAVERRVGPDRITYRQWRLVLGWQLKSASSAKSFGLGPGMNAELGYLFGREFQFGAAPDLSLGNTLLLSTGFRY